MSAGDIPPAKIITMSAEPMAKGAIGPASPGFSTVKPIVATKKPINSTTCFFIWGSGISGTKYFGSGRLRTLSPRLNR